MTLLEILGAFVLFIIIVCAILYTTGNLKIEVSFGEDKK